MSLTEEFEQAQADVQKLPRRPGNDVLLRLYALYKQGTNGDAAAGRPGMFDLVGRAKYDAWKALTGTAQDEAQRQYVTMVRDLVTSSA
jgi:diazepam-binding inhibitor (GABA receptor modulating acyl-CoA-binding protein)